SSTITFMGRIDDPLQLENSLEPTVEQNNARMGDFNSDGAVDDADYNVWKAAFGQIGSTLSADGNRDGIVDSADYVIWRRNFGRSIAAPSSMGDSQSGSLLADLASGKQTESVVDSASATVSAFTEDPVIAPNVEPEAVLPTSSTQRLKASLTRDHRVQIADDDFLLLAVASAPDAAVESANPSSIAKASDYEPSRDDAFAVLGVQMEIWRRAALGV
ncbi:MAG TPA: hypothetical protein VHK01_04460, partial [Lacipirellulaceae bacterium]|nr:hypothetical protein [Lacipirellulaceae bacterium]